MRLLRALEALAVSAFAGLAFLASAPLRSDAQTAEDSRFIRVVDQADRGEMVFLIGPVDLPASAATGSHIHTAGLPLQHVEFPRAGWIHGFATDMVDASGASVETDFLHHVNVIDPGNRELFSPIARRIMAAGPETGQKELPGSMGLPLDTGQGLLVKAVFHNPTPVDQRGLYLRIRFDFTPSRAGEGRAGVFPLYLDVKPPVGSKAFDLLPGLSSQSWEGSPAVTGRLLAAAGHMHDHATSLRLEDVTAAELLWEAKPETDEDGRIRDIPVGMFVKKGGVPLRSDHVYRLTVTYDNPTGETIRNGGMGTLGGVFILEPGEKWPAVEAEDPAYRADMRHQRSLGAGRQAEAEPDEAVAADAPRPAAPEPDAPADASDPAASQPAGHHSH